MNISYIYLFQAIFVFMSDRFTKILALNLFKSEFLVNKILSFQVVFNRGISWGIFNSYNDFAIILITLLILLVIIYLIYYSYTRIKENYKIFGEVFVIAGAISNIVDRFIYGAVIDFIEIHYKNWYFPSFNLADAYILFGVSLMFIEIYNNE